MQEYMETTHTVESTTGFANGDLIFAVHMGNSVSDYFGYACLMQITGIVVGASPAIRHTESSSYNLPANAQCQGTVDEITKRRAAKQGTAKAEYMKLDEMGILGVTHMMMLDSNSNQIADLMIGWVGKNVKSAPKR